MFCYLATRLHSDLLQELCRFPNLLSFLRDWSLITAKGGYKLGKSGVRKLVVPPPSRQGKTFCVPLLKSGNILRPPSIWLKLQATA